jgi:cytochrome P450
MPPRTAEPTMPPPTAGDPYPGYQQLREAGAVHAVREPTGLRRHTVAHYQHARDLLADDRISKDPRNAWEQLRQAGYLTGDPETDQYIFHIANCDPPDHTRLRRLVQMAFTTRQVERLRPGAQELADDLLDRAGGAVVDLVGAYAWPLAMTVTAELLGVPRGGFDEYRVWATAMLIPPGTPDPPMSRPEAYRRTREFFADLLVRRRAALEAGERPVDLLSALIEARDGADRLTEEEMVALVIFMLNTGQEPTVNLVGNATLALLDRPDQLDLLLRRPELLPAAIDEFLRFDAPVASSSLRIAREDIPVGDTVIPRGGIVSILFGAANRDPARYADPDRLDVTRRDSSHLAFGHGIHRCVGAPLGRMVAEVALGTLLRRHPGLELACPADELRWRPTRVTRGVEALPIRLDPAR